MKYSCEGVKVINLLGVDIKIRLTDFTCFSSPIDGTALMMPLYEGSQVVAFPVKDAPAGKSIC